MELLTQVLDLTQAPFQNDLTSWGRTLCVAPHPDDESLGCGGTLAFLRQNSLPVAVAWVSDGGLSHPNSASYPRARLAQLREQEALGAITKLGLETSNAYFQRFPDGALPFPGEPTFEQAVASAREILTKFQPQTLLLPWRRDPHQDHRASWAIWTQAAQETELQRFEYLVWAFERAAPHEWPHQHEAEAFRVDISEVLELKREAIEAHESQTTRLINDDPTAFWLSPEVISHFEKPYETWIKPHSSSLEDGFLEHPNFEAG